jgi:hypothetical protein
MNYLKIITYVIRSNHKIILMSYTNDIATINIEQLNRINPLVL